MPVLRADEAKPAAPPSVRTAETVAYHVMAEDVLEIAVQDHADLSKTTIVLPDGMISYPYVGEFKATGLTLREITDRITLALSKEIASPMVTVTIKSLHERPVSQVTILGPVRSAGKHNLKEGWRVLDLLIEAGGLAGDHPEAFSASLIRNGTEVVPVDLTRVLSVTDTKANIVLTAGDVLLIHELAAARTHVQILGEVARPGVISIEKDGSVVTALSAVGGPTFRAALSKATITRNGKINVVDLSGFLSEGKVPENVKLEAGDTLFIPQNKLSFGVYGAVGRPGILSYPDSQTITALTALTIAGGQGPDSNLKAATIIRPSKTGKPTVTLINLEDVMKKGDLSKDVALQPGDTLYIPSRKHKGGLSLSSVLSALPFMSLLGFGLR